MKLENFYKEIIHRDEQEQEISRELLAPPHNYTMPDGSTIINFHLNPESMTAEGWREWTDEELEEWHAKYAPELPEPVLRFSKLKIMEFLGGKWQETKEKLMADGLWDHWENAAFLSTDHPVFQRFFASLAEEEKEALIAGCQWE